MISASMIGGKVTMCVPRGNGISFTYRVNSTNSLRDFSTDLKEILLRGVSKLPKAIDTFHGGIGIHFLVISTNRPSYFWGFDFSPKMPWGA